MTALTKGKEDELFEEIWGRLSKIDVSEFAEDRGGLTYLSWASAWSVLMDNFPGAQFEFIGDESNMDCHFYPDSTASVTCIVTIFGVVREMWLPVMDFRHNAIKNPTSRAISDAKMRCLTKCLALFGLGMHIFRGEDLPPSTDEDPNPSPKKFTDLSGSKKKKATKTKSTEKGEHKQVIAIRELLVEAASEGKELVDVWNNNAETMKKLKSENPEAYASVVELFKNKRDELAEKDKNGK